MIISYVGSAIPAPIAPLGWIAAYSISPPSNPPGPQPTPTVRIFYAWQLRYISAAQVRDLLTAQQRTFTAIQREGDEVNVFNGVMKSGEKLPWHINIKKMVEGRDVSSAAWTLDSGLALLEQIEDGDYVTGHIHASSVSVGQSYNASVVVTTTGSPPIAFKCQLVLKIE